MGSLGFLCHCLRFDSLDGIDCLRNSIGQGQSPRDALIDGALILAGGLLLLTPGILTDGLGFSALLPPSRRLIRSALKEAISRRINRQTIDTHFTVS